MIEPTDQYPCLLLQSIEKLCCSIVTIDYVAASGESAM